MGNNCTLAGEKEQRYARIEAAMQARGYDAILAYGPSWRKENVRFLNNRGYRSPFAFCWFAPGGVVKSFFPLPDDRTKWDDEQFSSDDLSLSCENLQEVIEVIERTDNCARIGIAHLELLPYAFHKALKTQLPSIEFVSATPMMDELRLIKSEWEIERLRKSGKICDVAWKRFCAAIKPGKKEYEITAELEACLAAEGADDNFMLIASGGGDVRGMTPPSDRELCVGDMVRTEVTPQFKGYWAQICRTVVVGPPSVEQLQSFELFNKAVQAGIAVIRPGIKINEVAKAENDAFREAGYGEYCTAEYTRVRGHCLGLHLDEVPVLENVETVLHENSVLIVHPNTFTPLAGYHVLGDPVVVTSEGAVPLISTPRELDYVEV